MRKRHLRTCEGREGASHVGIWGKSIQVEETACAKALRVHGGFWELVEEWRVMGGLELRGLEGCPQVWAFT